jgi:hypothetical protein
MFNSIQIVRFKMKRLTLICLLCAVAFQYANAQKMSVKDSDGNVLMEVNDEGVVGSVILPDTNAALSSQTNKLYNLNGALIWNGAALGTSGSAGGWTDGGTKVTLTTSGDSVGIGISSPSHKLDVSGTIGIDDVQMLYVPPQGDYFGTMMVGNGGGSLTHSTGSDGQNNTGIGIHVLFSNTTGYDNTAVGSYALSGNTYGFMNAAFGANALSPNTTGSYNSAFGYVSLGQNTTAWGNTAFGAGTLALSTTGSENTAVGMAALSQNTTGNKNIGIGYHAKYNNQSGISNTVIGYEAGKGASTHSKSGNVLIGYQAGYNETGDNKLYIENSNSATPLIYGNFSSDSLIVNGTLNVADKMSTAARRQFRMEEHGISFRGPSNGIHRPGSRTGDSRSCGFIQRSLHHAVRPHHGPAG